MSERMLRNFVNGQYADARTDDSFEVIDPATEKGYAHSPVSSDADVDAAFGAAAAAFETWGETTPAERQLALFRIADELEHRAEEFADLESQDTGKPRASLVTDEILLSVDQLRFFAGAARNLEGRSAGEYMADHTSFIRREPIGVIAQVTPWNYPLNMAAWKVGPALAAGNTIVLKPSDTTPLTTLLFAEIAAEFLPPGVFNVITGDRTTGALMVDHPTPQMVAITGSVRAGMEVARAASADLKRVHLELGGKAPVIVFPDADLEKTVEGIATAAYFNAGQDCTAATRLLVHEDIHDAFVEAFVAHVRTSITTGDPHDANTFFGPVNNATQLERVLGIIGALPSHAEVRTGGTRRDGHGYFIEPTVVTGLRQDDDAVQNEIFGPVVTVQKFRDEAQALEWANDVNYGLSSSVWTSDHARAMRFAKRLDFGCVWINTHIPIVAEMPHGGFKESGYGKDLSIYALEDYTRVKHAMVKLG